MTTRTALATLAVLPVALPAAYLLYLKYRVSGMTTASMGRVPQRKQDKPPAEAAPSEAGIPMPPITLPEGVEGDIHGSNWILVYERVVSNPIPASALLHPVPGTVMEKGASFCDGKVSPLMCAYSQATQIAFSWTPQAFAIRASVCVEEARRTFEEEWIRGLSFDKGDVVNAAYRVSYCGKGRSEGSERVELMLQRPPLYKGHVPRAIVVTEVQTLNRETGQNGEDKQVVFVNETWMWREESEKPTIIESSTGAWMHTLLAGWLVMKGVTAVTKPKQRQI